MAAGWEVSCCVMKNHDVRYECNSPSLVETTEKQSQLKRSNFNTGILYPPKGPGNSVYVLLSHLHMNQYRVLVAIQDSPTAFHPTSLAPISMKQHVFYLKVQLFCPIHWCHSATIQPHSNCAYQHRHILLIIPTLRLYTIYATRKSCSKQPTNPTLYPTIHS